MVSLGHVAWTGRRCVGNASRDKAMSHGRLTEKQKVLADEISDVMAEAKTVDLDEERALRSGKTRW